MLGPTKFHFFGLLHGGALTCKVYQGIKDHVNLDLVKCVLLAGPGFVKDAQPTVALAVALAPRFRVDTCRLIDSEKHARRERSSIARASFIRPLLYPSLSVSLSCILRKGAPALSVQDDSRALMDFWPLRAVSANV